MGKTTRQRWEYTRLAIPAGVGLVERLNELGAQGWELVAVKDEGDIDLYLFKRGL